MTDADFRAEMQRELALTMDVEVRGILVAAIIAGPGTKAWSEALAIIGLRALGHDVKASQSRERAEKVWRRVDHDLQREAARGRFVSTFALLAVIALSAGVGLLLGWCAIASIMRWGSL